MEFDQKYRMGAALILGEAKSATEEFTRYGDLGMVEQIKGAARFLAQSAVMLDSFPMFKED